MPCIAERGSHVVGPCITFGVERMLVDGLLPTNLIPEAILTVGLPPMSKAVRKALSGVPHWHIGEDLTGEGMGWDVWDALQGSAPASVLTFSPQDAFFKAWTDAKHHVEALSTHFKAEWSDLSAAHLDPMLVFMAQERRPKALHVANSASARYAQWVDLRQALHPRPPSTPTVASPASMDAPPRLWVARHRPPHGCNPSNVADHGGRCLPLRLECIPHRPFANWLAHRGHEQRWRWHLPLAPRHPA